MNFPPLPHHRQSLHQIHHRPPHQILHLEVALNQSHWERLSEVQEMPLQV